MAEKNLTSPKGAGQPQAGAAKRDAAKPHKPGWKVWRFDQIATNVNARTDNPSESGMAHYVGLEHLDADSLKIRRWGTPDDVEATKLMFKKGDIIFGRRRAFQRKLGVAEFDGICSAHAMVLRAKPDVVLPEFLPFFMQSDLFMNRAVEISVGSLSPTINWKTMAVQEFALPPLERQLELVTLLESIEALRTELGDALESAWALRLSAYQSLMFHDWPTEAPQHWCRSTIGQSLKIENSLRKPISADIRASMQGDFPYYGPTGKLDSINESRLDGTYVLLGEDGDHFLKYKTWSMTQMIVGKANVNNHAHVIRGAETCSTDWFFHFYRHKDVREFLTKQGAGRLKLKKSDLERMPILVPSREEQAEIIAKIQECVDGTEALRARKAAVTELLRIAREKAAEGVSDV